MTTGKTHASALVAAHDITDFTESLFGVMFHEEEWVFYTYLHKDCANKPAEYIFKILNFTDM